MKCDWGSDRCPNDAIEIHVFTDLVTDHAFSRQPLCAECCQYSRSIYLGPKFEAEVAAGKWEHTVHVEPLDGLGDTVMAIECLAHGIASLARAA